MRSYMHDDKKVQRLFASIISRLSQGGTQSDIILGLLKDVCEHFHFGSGLVYETDHTGTLFLAEHHSVYTMQTQVPLRLQLDEVLNKKEIKKLRHNQMLVMQPQLDQQYINDSLSLLFAANSLVICPIVIDRGQVVGLVAMVDRRRRILMNPASLDAAKTVLNLLATHIRFRFLQKRLSLTQESLSSVLDHMGVDVYVSDYETREILFINSRMADLYGGRDALIGRKCYEVISVDGSEACELCPRDRLVDKSGVPTSLCTWEYQRPRTGSWQRVYSSAFPWVDGRLAQVTTSVDITESKENEAIINQLAYYDQLTKLPNRRKLFQDCAERLPEIEKAEGHAWIMFFDLDDFKAVNDTLGHQAGDELLQSMGRFFDNDPETAGRFYRLGGDEFVLLFENVSRKFVLNVIDRLLLRSSRPWNVSGGGPICRTSVGISRFPDDGRCIEILLNKADQALYQAKEGGKGRAVFCDGKFERSIDDLLNTPNKKNWKSSFTPEK